MEVSDVWAEEIFLEQPTKKRHVVTDKNRAIILFLIESSPLFFASSDYYIIFCICFL